MSEEFIIKVEEKDLWHIYLNRERAIQAWFSSMINTFGVIPDEIVVSRLTHNLMFVYLRGRGIMAAGNWLGLELSVSYDPRYDVNDMMLYDWFTGSEIVYGGGAGAIINFTEKDILKRRKDEVPKKTISKKKT